MSFFLFKTYSKKSVLFQKMIRIRLTVTSESLVRLDVNFRHRLLTVPVDCPKGMRFKIVELCARIDRMNAAHVGEIEDYRCEPSAKNRNPTRNAAAQGLNLSFYALNTICSYCDRSLRERSERLRCKIS